jgi:hypothetical protein
MPTMNVSWAMLVLAALVAVSALWIATSLAR